MGEAHAGLRGTGSREARYRRSTFRYADIVLEFQTPNGIAAEFLCFNRVVYRVLGSARPQADHARSLFMSCGRLGIRGHDATSLRS